MERRRSASRARALRAVLPSAVARVKDGSMRLERYCTCGGVLNVTVSARRKQQALIVFYNHHSGEGHERTTAAGAEQARMGNGQPGGREYERSKGRG
jgi:hypothetical protein